PEAPGAAEGAAGQPAAAFAEERRARALGGIDHFDLTIVRVGDVEFAVLVGDAEGVLETDLAADAVVVAELEEPFADDGLHLAGRIERHRADGADLAVGDVEILAVAGEAAGLGEGRLLVAAVG